MRTHIQRTEIDQIPVCCDYETTIPIAWAGYTQMTLEEFITLPIGGAPTPPRDALYILVHLMTPEDRMKFGYLVLNELENSEKFPGLRALLNVVNRFIKGTITEEKFKNSRNKLKKQLIDDRDGSTEKKRKNYRQLDAVCNLMTREDTRKETMLLCRLVESHHTNATWDRFRDLAIQVLKEEV